MSKRIVLHGEYLMGDTLMQTPVIRALRQRYPKAQIQYATSEDSLSYQMLQQNPHLNGILTRWEGDLEPNPQAQRFDMMAAWLAGYNGIRPLIHALGQQFGLEVPDFHYDYHITPEEAAAGRALYESLPKGRLVAVARHSTSCMATISRENPPNKCLENRIWVDVARWLISAGYVPVAIGGAEDEGDDRFQEWPGVKLYGAPIRQIAPFLTHCAGVLTVDTGIRHLAAAVGANLFCYSGAVPLYLIACQPRRPEQRVYELHLPVDRVSATDLIFAAAYVLQSVGRGSKR